MNKYGSFPLPRRWRGGAVFESRRSVRSGGGLYLGGVGKVEEPRSSEVSLSWACPPLRWGWLRRRRQAFEYLLQELLRPGFGSRAGRMDRWWFRCGTGAAAPSGAGWGRSSALAGGRSTFNLRRLSTVYTCFFRHSDAHFPVRCGGLLPLSSPAMLSTEGSVRLLGGSASSPLFWNFVPACIFLRLYSALYVPYL